MAVDAVDAGARAAPLGAPRGTSRLVRLPDERPCRRHRACSEAAVARLDGRPPSGEAAACLASLANFTMYAGQYREAVPIAERAIVVSDAVGARGRKVEAMGALGASLALAGDCGRGLAVLRDALDDGEGAG